MKSISPSSCSLLVASVLLAISSAPVQACTVCFNGNASQDDVTALNGAIFLMFGVLALVLGSFVAFFVHLARKAKQPLPEHVAFMHSINEDDSHSS